MRLLGRLGRVHRDESGTVLVLVTLVMVALLLIAGLVIDIGGVRIYRADQQTISDAAAAAGAVALAETQSGQAACGAAKSYVIANADAVDSLSGIDCASYPLSCDADTGEHAATTVEGRFTVSVVFPVPDDSALLESGVLGAITQPASSHDGTQCERIGVAINSEWDTTFSKLAGVESFNANVHTVAKGTLITAETIPLNLLVLDRTGCQTLHASGGGGIYIDPIYIPDQDNDPSNGLQPALGRGFAASDSDGSDGCSSGDGAIDLDGSGSVLRADGPAGCANQSGTYLIAGLIAGEGCGRIRVLAPGTPGCNFPACTAGGGNLPNPEPTALRQQITRASVDHRFNCKTDYTTIDPSLSWATWPLTIGNQQDIAGCPDPPAPYIDQLIQLVGETGTPPGFQSWTGAGYPCTIDGAPGFSLEVPAGDWYIDCPAFANKRTIVFQGGDLVFDGSVTVESGAILAINANPATYTAAEPENWVFLRRGTFTKAGDASVIMNNTTLYASKEAHLAMAGGSGILRWIAPNQGNFDDLALWGDSPTTHQWAGQAELTLEGAFFTPFATVEYAGTSGQNQVRAQFIANRLHTRGNGVLTVAPALGRAIEFKQSQSTLIR